MSEWIRCDERMPSSVGYYFAYFPLNNIGKRPGMVYFNGKEFPYHEPGAITHWQPLPEPPK